MADPRSDPPSSSSSEDSGESRNDSPSPSKRREARPGDTTAARIPSELSAGIPGAAQRDPTGSETSDTFWGNAPNEAPRRDHDSLRSDFRDWLESRALAGASGADDDTIDTLSGRDDGLEAPALPTTVEEIYEDRGEVGHGGMGSVRRVFDRRLRREAALKILKTELGKKHREKRRFLEEAQITGQLDHPNIVPIHDLGQDSLGSHYFTMKLVQGKTLEATLDEAGSQRLETEVLADFLQIFVKICEAVSFAHSRGVVHRDLKPANIMVGEFGQVYVMDWGIARILPQSDPVEPSRRLVSVSRSELTDIDAPGTILGTPRYMAPEQVNGDHESTDHRADIFALGGILYQVLTGHAPYTEQNYFSLLVQVQNCEVRRPLEIPGCERVPAELERIALRAMAAEPDSRYASVIEMQKEVERFLRGVWHLPTETYAAGTAIITEGDEGDAAYIIKKGRCRVLKNINGRPAELRTMGPGDVFGETAIFSSSRRSATVETLDHVEVTVVTSEVLTQGLGLNSWMGDFVKALANRFRELDGRLHGLDGDGDGPKA